MSDDRMTPADVVVEPAHAGDATAIKALISAARLNPTSLDWRNFLVARDGSEDVVGCIQAMNSPLSGKRELKSLVVRPDLRGCGVADRLLEAITERETRQLWGTCLEALVPYYLKRGCRVPAPAETPAYYRLLKIISAALHVLTLGHAPRVAVMVFEQDHRDV